MHFSLSLSFFCSLAWLTLYALLLSFHHLHSPLRSVLRLSFLSLCIYFSVLKAFNLTVAQCHPSMVHYKDWKIAFSELSINVRAGETLPPDSLSLSLSLITSLLHHSPSHVLLMYLWNYWNVNVPLLPLIFKTKGYRCAGCTHTDTGPTGNGKGALISLFVMLQRVPPPCVFFWISLVHPSPTSLPFSARNSRIHNGTAQCSTEGWATINEWLFSIHRSHCGCYNWLHLWNHTMRCYISVTEEGAQKNDLQGKINDFNTRRLNNRPKAWQIGLQDWSLWPSLSDDLNLQKRRQNLYFFLRCISKPTGWFWHTSTSLTLIHHSI